MTRGLSGSSRRAARISARAAARDHRPARREDYDARPRRATSIRETRAASSSPSPSPTSLLRSAGWRWTGKRSSAAIPSIPRPRRADVARAHLQRPLLAEARTKIGRRSPPHRPRRRRPQASHKFHRIMMRSAAKLSLRAGPGCNRRSAGRNNCAASRRPLRPFYAAYAASNSNASVAIRSISTCPSASSFSTPPRGGSRTCAGRSGSTRIG